MRQRFKPLETMAQDIQKNKQFDFEETQRFTNWLVWTSVIGALLLLITILFYQMITDKKVGNHPASSAILICLLCIYYIPFIFLMLCAKLTVRIDKDTIYYGWNLPTSDLNKINVSNIASATLIKYGFVGYGYKLTKKYGVVYNSSGNEGLLITTRSGEKMLLGTKKAKELEDTLTKLNIPQTL